MVSVHIDKYESPSYVDFIAEDTGRNSTRYISGGINALKAYGVEIG